MTFEDLKEQKAVVDIRHSGKVYTLYTNLIYLKMLVTTDNVEVIGLDYIV